MPQHPPPRSTGKAEPAVQPAGQFECQQERRGWGMDGVAMRIQPRMAAHLALH
jgi:hypothetical protein